MWIANALLRFGLELLFVFSLALGGASLAGWPLAVAAPVFAIVAWRRWIAPRAPRPQSDPPGSEPSR